MPIQHRMRISSACHFNVFFSIEKKAMENPLNIHVNCSSLPFYYLSCDNFQRRGKNQFFNKNILKKVNRLYHYESEKL